MSFARGPRRNRTLHQRSTRQNAFSLPSGSKLHQLSFTGARLEPPLGIAPESVTLRGDSRHEDQSTSRKRTESLKRTNSPSCSQARPVGTAECDARDAGDWPGRRAGEDRYRSDGEIPWPEQPDLSRWPCRNCPLVEGWTGSVLFGGGYISGDFLEFGNYRGLDKQGGFAELGADLIYRGSDARYIDIYGERLGLDSRTLLIEGGKQGSYRLSLGWDEINHLREDNALTPFLGAGSSNQTLPADWVLAGTTGGMTALEQNLRSVKIGSDRDILTLGIEFGGKSPWRYRADFERTSRSGNSIRGASFIFRAAELAAPVDYQTTRLDAGIAYVKDRWQLEASYNLSHFENDNQALFWENPFTGILGAQLGQLAEPPDNQFHQFMLSGSWNQSR